MGLEQMPAGPGLTVGQVGRQVRHHVAADQLPAEVIVLALAVLTLGQVVVFLKGAARCGQTDVSVPPQTSCSLPKSPAGMDAAASHKEGEWCGHLSLCSLTPANAGAELPRAATNAARGRVRTGPISCLSLPSHWVSPAVK